MLHIVGRKLSKLQIVACIKTPTPEPECQAEEASPIGSCLGLGLGLTCQASPSHCGAGVCPQVVA